MRDAKWDTRFMNLAYEISTWSKDPSTKIGAVIVKGKGIVSTGFNGFPKKTSDFVELYKNRETKLLRVLHAEINAILYAKCDLTGCTLYCTAPPCCQCTAAIIQSGISKVVYMRPTELFEEKWKDHLLASRQMMDEAGVEYYVY